MKRNTKAHADVLFMELISSLKPHQISILEPYLKDTALDVFCGLINFLLSNPSADKFGHKKKKIAKLVKANKEIFEKIAGKNSAGKKFKHKRKVISGAGFPLIPILSAVIPSIITAISSRL